MVGLRHARVSAGLLCCASIRLHPLSPCPRDPPSFPPSPQRYADPTSHSGTVVRVLDVWWLELGGRFRGVLPGRYRAAWRTRLEVGCRGGNSLAGEAGRRRHGWLLLPVPSAAGVLTKRLPSSCFGHCILQSPHSIPLPSAPTLQPHYALQSVRLIARPLLPGAAEEPASEGEDQQQQRQVGTAVTTLIGRSSIDALALEVSCGCSMSTLPAQSSDGRGCCSAL